ncbi:methyltransferase family protein [Hymenobacter caeli]|uniref:Protein-S-isoprenylcysteine O-methyltransferase Ste14 n=1 Tax=Hymenobacter caeli TaxID=2735894 RepID=A0ABX2FVY9_9BACT|nr:isoprenylcysteine carboxylmethyltransferase family protein [Hymenobacter caeli]NRT21361.1 protein-S-isoprenylcysteine O-methyltransferase Ste14 [Hymenobacter caeli]
MPLLFLLVYAGWFLSEILLNRLMRSSAADQPNADKHSLGLIWATLLGANGLAVYLAEHSRWPVGPQRLVPELGLALIVLGVALRLLVIRSLGRFFTVDVTIREGHQLKTDGFYAYLRHPSYAASLLSFVGFGLSLNNWPALLLVTAATLAAFSYRIWVEEAVLTRQFGTAYTDYQKRTKRLIPAVY